MLPEDRELLADLKRACNQAGQFALEYMGGELSVEGEEAYAWMLVDIAERLLAHTKARKELVLDGEPSRLVIDAPGVVVDCDGRKLLPRSGGTEGTKSAEQPPASEPGDAWS